MHLVPSKRMLEAASDDQTFVTPFYKIGQAYIHTYASINASDDRHCRLLRLYSNRTGISHHNPLSAYVTPLFMLY